MLIRKATIEDLADLAKLGHLLAKHESKIDPLLSPITLNESNKHYIKELKNRNAIFFVSQNFDGKIVGYVYGYIAKAPKHILKYKKIGYIEAAYVEKKYRGNNLGKKMTEALISWFSKNNISLVELGVYAKNGKSLSVWQSLGFHNYHIKMRRVIRQQNYIT